MSCGTSPARSLHCIHHGEQIALSLAPYNRINPTCRILVWSGRFGMVMYALAMAVAVMTTCMGRNPSQEMM